MRNLIHDSKAVTPFVPAVLTESEPNNLVLKQDPARSLYVNQQCIHTLLEKQALLTPSSTAIVYRGTALTYRELDERSTQLGHLLRQRGVGPEVVVGVCLERSLEMMVGLLGILKAGGAYVPIDPSYPEERIRYVLEDAQVRVLLTQAGLVSSMPSTGAEVLCLDSSWSLFEQESREPVKGEVKAENLAYVIYTSGSTGKPKGVQVEHGSVVNFLHSMRQEPGMREQDRLLAVTTLSFDIAGLELYLPLLVGGCVEIADREAASDGRRLMELLQRSKATVMQATPATWRLLLESGWKGDRELKVLVGGEALPSELGKQLVGQCRAVWNLYGPTETTIWSSTYRVRGDERLVPIGRPIANTRFYILDANQQPVPVGGEGELYIGGEGVARGYFQRPELTAEKFVEDRFSGQVGARMYRTGDLARYRTDGTVEYLGRLDNQVKIRGFRIELGEIEAVLEKHEAIASAVTVAREDVSGEKFLASYVVRKIGKSLDLCELRAYLGRFLPDYMLPAAVVELQSLPLTPNGKVDRKSLPRPEALHFSASKEHVPPRDPVEKKLVALWEEVLNIRPISIHSSFFDLGGRSILAARLFMRISSTFGQDLPLAALFQAPTVEKLAKELRERSQALSYRTLVSIQPGGSKPPFFCVHGGTGNTLFLHRLARAMGTDRPFYGFEPEGLDGRAMHRKTIEEMAARYIAEMKKVQPQGPYYIGGYCFGGIVAFEMAQQLRTAGDGAAVVALFSAPLRFNRPTCKPRSLPGPINGQTQQFTKVQRFLRSPSSALRWRLTALRRRTRLKVNALICRAFLSVGAAVPQAVRTMYVVRMITRAEQSYRPQTYPGSLVLFRGRGLYENDPHMGWDGLAESLENHEIGKDETQSRRDIMNEPLVQLLADKLTEVIERASVPMRVPPTEVASP